ncbi:hypothetical protein LQZ19_05465 [Treponema primitia]|uniref:hypothetical protein n=1 Tax=Treponema primitia TaxID=88058 RepID=UPI00398151BF
MSALKRFNQIIKYLITFNFSKIKFKTINRIIIMIFSFLLILQAGYESGKEKGVKDAQSFAEKQYKPKVIILEDELSKIETTGKNRIESINKNHVAKIKMLNNEHIIQVNKMNSNHNSQVDEINRIHDAEINLTKDVQAKELEQTRKNNYSNGQTDMGSRIAEMIDLNIENKEVIGGWNDTVYTIKK